MPMGIVAVNVLLEWMVDTPNMKDSLDKRQKPSLGNCNGTFKIDKWRSLSKSTFLSW